VIANKILGYHFKERQVNIATFDSSDCSPLTYAGVAGEGKTDAMNGQNSITRCHEMKADGRNMS
jgi:hypothetical protein